MMLETSLRQACQPAFSCRLPHRKLCRARGRPVCSSQNEQPSITRREGLAAASALLVARPAFEGAAMAAPAAPAAPVAPFELPPLPYAMDALEPKGMSKLTLSFHYGKHHAAYCSNLNKQIEANKELQNLPLMEVMLKAWNAGKPTAPFNNAAQVVNHTFFWESMSPNGGGQPKGKLLEAINRDFGSFDAFKAQFKTAGLTQFGSGWAWLVAGKDGKLKVTKTPNAENPWVYGETPLLTCDVWEHAYYLDEQNRRGDYIDIFLNGLVDWDAAERRFRKA